MIIDRTGLKPISINGKIYTRLYSPGTGCRECVFDDDIESCNCAQELDEINCIPGHFIYKHHEYRDNNVDDYDDLIIVSIIDLKSILCEDFCPYGNDSTYCNTDTCMIRAIVDIDKQL